MNSGDLGGKSVLITGGGTGIGQATAAALAAAGARVAIAGRRLDKLQAAATAGSTPAAPIHFHAVDVAQRQSVEELVAWTNETLGPLDILVNNAGVNIPRRLLSEITPQDWEYLLSVNATGAFHLLQAVLPGMRERQDGLVININSISGKRAAPLGGVAYNAAKFAMNALATSAALENGKFGVRVTSIFPGEVDTPILEHRPAPVSAERRAAMLKAEDIAAAVLFIARLPARAHVAELVIKPTVAEYV